MLIIRLLRFLLLMLRSFSLIFFFSPLSRIDDFGVTLHARL